MENRKSKILSNVNLLILTFSFMVFVIAAQWASPTYAEDKGKVFRWRLQHAFPPGTNWDDSMKKMAENIKTMSNGRLDIKIFAAGSLVSVHESFDALSKGIFEAHMNIPAYWTGKMRAAQVLMSMPGMGFERAEDFSAWYWKRGGIEIAREVYAKFNIFPVGFAPMENMAAIFARKDHPIRSLEDFKGLKIRAVPGIMTDILRALGATPVPLPYAEVYTSLETGVIDAAITGTLDMNYKMGLHQVTHWIVWPSLWMPTAAPEVAVGMDAWKQLPPDLQNILIAAVRNWAFDIFAIVLDGNCEAMKKMKVAGIESIYLPAKDVKKIREVALSIEDKWTSKDPSAAKVWASQKEFMSLLELLK